MILIATVIIGFINQFVTFGGPHIVVITQIHTIFRCNEPSNIVKGVHGLYVDSISPEISNLKMVYPPVKCGNGKPAVEFRTLEQPPRKKGIFPHVLWFSLVFLWFSYRFPVVFLWFSYRFPVVFLWFS